MQRLQTQRRVGTTLNRLGITKSHLSIGVAPMDSDSSLTLEELLTKVATRLMYQQKRNKRR